jgi:hypothetical protein
MNKTSLSAITRRQISLACTASSPGQRLHRAARAISSASSAASGNVGHVVMRRAARVPAQAVRHHESVRVAYRVRVREIDDDEGRGCCKARTGIGVPDSALDLAGQPSEGRGARRCARSFNSSSSTRLSIG